jgi:hypothetical protein
VLGLLGKVNRFQVAEYLLQFFKEKLGIVEGVVVYHHHFMCGIVFLGKDGWQIVLEIMRFVAGTNNHTYGVRLRLEFVLAFVEHKAQEKIELIKQVDACDYAKQYECN